MNEKIRCFGDTPIYIDYHDSEWGRPVHDDHKLFEMLILEGAQAGLSWITVLKKREAYREAFDGFDPKKSSAIRRCENRRTHGKYRNHKKPPENQRCGQGREVIFRDRRKVWEL